MAVDAAWRYVLITQLVSHYDLKQVEYARDWLMIWATEPGNDECDLAALDTLTEQEAITSEELLIITRKNLFYYNAMIEDTMRLMRIGLKGKPFGEYTL